MNSGKITLGLGIAFLLLIAAIGIMKLPEAYAATTALTNTTTSVTVNGLVSSTLFNVPVGFPSVDPGSNWTQANATLGGPLIVQIDAATNVDVNVYINGSDFTGAGSMAVGNLSYNSTAPTSGSTNSTCTAIHSCVYKTTRTFVFNDTARLGTAQNGSIMHYISIPAIQAPGTYTNNLNICVTQTSVGGC